MGAISRKIYVDATSGDVANATDAIAAAVAAGVSPTNQMILEFGLGTFFPATGSTVFDFPAGLSVEGQGTHRTNLSGSIILNPASTMKNLRVNPGAGLVTFGVRCNLDAAYNTYSIQLDNVNVTVVHNTLADILTGLEVTGAATGAFVYVMPGCYFYVQNRYTADNTSGAAKGVVFRLKSDVKTYIEGWGVHCKTSGGATGTAIQILRLVECNPTPLEGVHFGYVELADVRWNNVYGGTGGRTEGYLMQSVNTNWPGNSGSDVTYWSRGGGRPLIQTDYTGDIPACSHRIVESLQSYGEISRWDDGDEFPVTPSIILDHAPTVSDPAPQGTVAYVVP